jgi:hypothetical protein
MATVNDLLRHLVKHAPDLSEDNKQEYFDELDRLDKEKADRAAAKAKAAEEQKANQEKSVVEKTQVSTPKTPSSTPQG